MDLTTRPLRALLVDMDGTLVDTAAANYAAYAKALGEVGVTILRPEFDSIAAGRNWRQFLPALLGGEIEAAAAVAARKVALYSEFVPLMRVNHGLVRLIEAFHAQGRTALVTTASQANAEMVLSRHGLCDLFDAVVTGSDVARHKPDPEAYAIAAARLGVEPGVCLVVEDSDIGIESAKAFGAAWLRVSLAHVTHGSGNM